MFDAPDSVRPVGTRQKSNTLHDLVIGVPDVEIEYGDRLHQGTELWSEVHRKSVGMLEFGLRAGDRALLNMDLTDEYILALLAMLAIGLVVVPIDVSTPETVVREAAERSTAAVRITASGMTRYPERSSADCLSSSSDLQYVLFTSGSTGEPKGVMGSRIGLENRVRWGRDEFFSGDHRRCFVRTSPSFIDSLTEILSGVAAGKRLVVAPLMARQDMGVLSRFISENRIEQLTVTPSVVPALEHFGKNGPLRGVRRWIFSGERLRPDWIEQVRNFSPAAEIVNSYGSTEVSGDATFYRLEPTRPIPDQIPIGAPAPGVSWRIEPAAEESETDGCGELLVGGCQVALGYIGTDTAVGSPFSLDSVPGSPVDRWFRTGDLVEEVDGQLIYRGRLGQVAKVRGRRVDLDGAAVALESLSGIVDAVTWVESAPSGLTSLLAAVASDPNESPSVSTILRMLSAILPAHLVPDRLVIVGQLPRTVTGKIDLRALRTETGVDRIPREADFDTGIEYAIALGIAEAIGTGAFDAQTPLSELGLDSLRSVQAAEQISRMFGCRVDGLMLRSYNRVKDIARDVTRLQGETDSGPLRIVSTAECPAVMVFLPPAIGTCLGYIPLIAGLVDIATVAFVEQDPRATSVVESDGIDALSRHYADAIAQIFRGRSVHLVGYSFGGAIATTVSRALGERGVEVTKLVLLDPAIPTTLGDVDPDWAVRRILEDAGYLEYLTSDLISIDVAHDIIRRSPGPLEFVSSSQVEHWARTIATNNERLLGYSPPVCDGQTLVVTADERHHTVGDVGWVRTRLPNAELASLNCSHFELLHAPQATEVAQMIARFVGRIDEN